MNNNNKIYFIIMMAADDDDDETRLLLFRFRLLPTPGGGQPPSQLQKMLNATLSMVTGARFVVQWQSLSLREVLVRIMCSTK